MDGAQNGRRLKSRSRIIAFGPLIALGRPPLGASATQPRPFTADTASDGSDDPRPGHENQTPKIRR
jgi:hypothetical protein